MEKAQCWYTDHPAACQASNSDGARDRHRDRWVPLCPILALDLSKQHLISSCSIYLRKAVVAVIFLILAMLPGHVSYYQVPAAVLALLYSNSMLALLNSRINLNACRNSNTEPAPQTDCQMTTLRFNKSPRESGITGITSMDPSHRGIGAGRHLSFVTQGSRRISGLEKVCISMHT
jgi:hypothetical protein